MEIIGNYRALFYYCCLFKRVKEMLNQNYGDFMAIEGNKNNIIIHYIEEESCVIVWINI